MVSKRWLAVVAGKQHLGKLRLGYEDTLPFIGASGKVVDRILVDGEVVKEWNSSAWSGCFCHKWVAKPRSTYIMSSM